MTTAGSSTIAPACEAPTGDGPQTTPGPTATTVVLVDPRAERRSIMRQVFEHSDISGTVVGEADGEEDAVVLVDRHGADLVVIDFQPAVEEGLKTVAALRRRFPHLGIVVASFNRVDTARERALAEGADAYLPKPVTAREVVDAVRHPGRASVAPSLG